MFAVFAMTKAFAFTLTNRQLGGKENIIMDVDKDGTKDDVDFRGAPSHDGILHSTANPPASPFNERDTMTANEMDIARSLIRNSGCLSRTALYAALSLC